MSDPRLGAILRHASRLVGRAGTPTADAALLGRLTRGDSAAFAELVARHGPNVWALCRRLVRSEPDAEDVFQATFLVLARDASRVRKAASVGSWLFGVATRIGRKVREKARRAPDPQRLTRGEAPRDPAAELSWTEVRAALDEELGNLSDELRAPLLLCYFDGLTQDEAAAELGWSPRTVKARVARGRDLLRKRLTRRGVELPAALAVPLLSAEVATAVPPHLSAAFVSSLSPGRVTGLDVSPAAVRLAQTETHTVASLRLAILVVSAAGLLAAGTLVGSPAAPSTAAPANIEEQNPPPSANEPALPPGAVRIGSTLFRPQAGWHKKVFFTADGKTLVAPLEGKSIELWDPESGKRTHTISIPQSSFRDSDFAAGSNLLAVFGLVWPEDRAEKVEYFVWLVDTAAKKVVRTIPFREIDHSVHYQVRLTRDGKRLVTLMDGEIRVWDVKSGEELIRQKHRGGSDAFALSPDGKTVSFGRYDVFVWHWESGEEPKKLAALRGFGTEVIAFSGDGKSLYSAVEGGRVLTFEVATGRETASFDVGASPWKWSLSPDGKTLAIAYHDSKTLTGLVQAVVLWNPVTGKEKGRLPAGRSNATAPSWSPDGTRLAAATDYRLWVWDVKTGKPVGSAAPGHEGFITAFAFAPDGRLFTASDDHTIRSWDAATGKPGFELIHDAWVRGMALSPDGSLLAGSALRDDLRIWDAKTGTEKFRLLGNGQMGGKRKVQFTPDGKRLVAWGDDLYLRVWDMRNGKLLAEHRTLPEGITEAQLDDERERHLHLMGFQASDISADGSTFALCHYKVAQVFDVETGKERARFEVDPNGVSAIGLSPDGKRLGVGGRGKSIETRLPDGRTQHSSEKEHQFAVWDVATKTMTWKAMTTGVWSSEVKFSPDGKLVGESAGSDRKYTIRVWNAETGKEHGQIETLNGGSHFAFDAAGKRLAVSHSNTTATIYDLETALKPRAPK
jgi:RNA polymerase sigma factor (sigma-70 family)